MLTNMIAFFHVCVKNNLINGYEYVFGLANMLSGEVMLLSDHGTLGQTTRNKTLI